MAVSKTAAFFDLDKTIIATSSAAAFSRPFLAQGLMNRRAVLRSAYAHFLYLIGGADEDQTERMRAYLSDLVAGWDVAHVKAIVSETLHEHIDPYVYSEAVELIAEHHAAGRDVVVVSASGSELVEPIAAALGADHTVSTRMEVLDGHYTGKIDFYCYGENKAHAMRELAEQEGYDLSKSYAYSDSITDAPMLEAVGFGNAVNPDRGLRRLAETNGWGVLTFASPVSLWRHIPVSRTWSFSLVGAATVGIVLLWWLRRRRRRS
ncbi:HAD-superfamily subfamily IB hydrolase, TIGR01490 [Micrococcales bacterium KH10]|nr:HAD-superfamily subfamily IB hydrolase, TIGR01490 [Micrococcales bacterium KH10]